MARFRKIDPRIWNDAKFSSLSNEAKLLFIYLLTSPQMTVLGALPMRDTSVAAELGLDPIPYAIRYRELYDRGIAEYDERGLFWVKNFLKYNSPDNPKVVLSWTNAVDLLPECPLLGKILENAKSYCNQRGSAFADAYANSIGDRYPYGMPNSMPNGIVNRMAYKETEKETEKDIYEHSAKPNASSSSNIVSKIADLYNEIAPGHFIGLRSLTDKRKKAIRQFVVFLRKQTKATEDDAILSEAKSYFLRASRCEFLCGKNDRGWRADFDFLVNENKAVWVLEGKYDNKGSSETPAKENIFAVPIDQQEKNPPKGYSNPYEPVPDDSDWETMDISAFKGESK